MKTRILVIDGGGVRGILPLETLKWMETRCGRPINDLFDLIIGVSTGGLVALALTKENPLTAAQVSEIYHKRSSEIFSRGIGREVETLDGILGAKYGTDGLKAVLSEAVGDGWLLQRGKALAGVVSFEVSQNLVHVLEPGPSWTLSELAQATSAAPTYFAPFHKDGLTFVDGGIATNSPELLALALAKEHFGVSPEDCLVLSLGTGRYCSPVQWTESAGWGLAQWAPKLADLFMTGAGGAEHVAMQVLAPHYVRLEPILTSDLVEMDKTDPEHLERLRALGEAYTHRQIPLLEPLCQQLLANRRLAG